MKLDVKSHLFGSIQKYLQSIASLHAALDSNYATVPTIPKSFERNAFVRNFVGELILTYKTKRPRSLFFVQKFYLKIILKMISYLAV